MSREDILKTIKALKPRLLSVSDYIYENPELGYQEFKAKKVLVKLLQEYGFTVQDGVGKLETAFKAVFPSNRQGPNVAFIAEYDALPGLGHACGHNLIGAAAVGAGIALAQNLPLGKVSVIGTPAEEIPPATKQKMIDNGVFDDVDIALMMHGNNRTTTKTGSLALGLIDYKFKGKASHAALYPHLGISALDAAIITFQAIEMLREHVRPDVKIHGIITNGGLAPNIVPESAALSYFARALENDYLDEVVRRMDDCARAGALATSAHLEIVHKGRVANKVLLDSLNDLVLENAQKAGALQIMLPGNELGSTDFGNITHYIPGVALHVAFMEHGQSLHTIEAYKAAGSEAGHRAIEVAALAMAWTGYDLLIDPQKLETVKNEHAIKTAK